MYRCRSSFGRCLVAVLAVAFATGFAAFAHSGESNIRQAKRPNFVFFLVDDLGWRDLGCYGSRFYETPNVDRLAATGMRFTDAYAACQVCSPSRAAIMTGKYPVRVAITDYINPAGRNQPQNWQRNTRLLPAPYNDRLPLEELTIAEALKQAGYATFFAGKWHLGPEGYYPENQGFDVNKGGCEWGHPVGGKRYFSPYGNPRLEDGPPGEHLPDRLAREACAFIEQNRDKPFFVYFSFYSVHTPLMGRDDLVEKYRKKALLPEFRETRWGTEGKRKVRLVQNHAVYAAMVEAMDQAVGKVLTRLDKLGLTDQTIVFFTSDNGGLSTSEGHPTSNLPLRAGKGWPYEGGLRVPLIIRWPGVTKPGSVCRVPVIHTDFYPTMLEMAGLPLRPEQHLDGLSLVPLLKGTGKLADRPLFWHYPHYGNQGGAPSGVVRLGRWKLIEWYEDGRLELFDLENDLGEKRNLADEYPETVSKLKQMLDDWRNRLGARMPSSNPNYRPPQSTK